MENKAKTGGELLAAVIEAEDALMEMLLTAAGLRAVGKRESVVKRDEALLESLQSSMRRMVDYGAALTYDLPESARMAKLAEIVEEFMRDGLPGLNADAAARAFDSLPPATRMLQ